MHLEDLHFTTQFCIAISDTHSRKGPLRAKKYLLDMQKGRARASSASVIWYIVSFGQKYTDRPLLAHQLAYYNSGDLWFRLILDYCPEIWFIRFVIIGMPVAAPTLIRDYIWPWLYWRKRVFQADLFACELGQCDALIRTLEARRNFQRRRGPMRTEPYIQERLNRLRRWRAAQLHSQMSAQP